MNHTKNVIFCVLISGFVAAGPLVQELHNLADALQELTKQLTVSAWRQDRLIGPATTPAMINTNPPYILKSGNQVLQIEVLSQFLTLGALSGKDYSAEALSGFASLVSTIQREKIISFIAEYVARIKRYDTSNKSLADSFEFTQDAVIGGGEASCGYHALKNAQTLLRAFKKEDPQNHLQDLIDITYANQLFGLAATNAILFGKNDSGFWRTLVVKKRKKAVLSEYLRAQLNQPFSGEKNQALLLIQTAANKGAQNILDEFIASNEQNLIMQLEHNQLIARIMEQNPKIDKEIIEQYMTSNAPVTIDSRTLFQALEASKQYPDNYFEGEWLQDSDIDLVIQDTKQTDISVFEISIESLTAAAEGKDKAVADEFHNRINERKELIATRFKKSITDYTHAFILGNMKIDSGLGHWATLVVNINQGSVQYITLDSMNAPRYPATLDYKTPPAYKEKSPYGPQTPIADHIKEIIELIEKARA